eukprot:scaffold200535_cov45-Prasinocladus_malaysianus.AAC.1
MMNCTYYTVGVDAIGKHVKSSPDGGNLHRCHGHPGLCLENCSKHMHGPACLSSLNIGRACGLWMRSGAWKSNGMACAHTYTHFRPFDLIVSIWYYH